MMGLMKTPSHTTTVCCKAETKRRSDQHTSLHPLLLSLITPSPPSSQQGMIDGEYILTHTLDIRVQSDRHTHQISTQHLSLSLSPHFHLLVNGRTHSGNTVCLWRRIITRTGSSSLSVSLSPSLSISVCHCTPPQPALSPSAHPSVHTAASHYPTLHSLLSPLSSPLCCHFHPTPSALTIHTHTDVPATLTSTVSSPSAASPSSSSPSLFFGDNTS